MSGTNNPPKSQSTIDSEVDRILDKVYGAGLIAGERYTKGKRAGTLTSDTLYSAKTAITNLIAQELQQIVVKAIENKTSCSIEIDNRLKELRNLTADKEEAE